MAYSTPPAFSGGATLPAADLTVLGDDIVYLKAITDGVSISAVRVTRASNQSIANATATSISFTAETYDYGGWYSSGTNVVVPAGAIPAGFTTILVDLVGRVRYATNGTGNRRVDVLVNGGSTGGVNLGGIASDPTDILTVESTVVAAGDIITLEVYQTSGGALNVETARLSVKRHAPAA